MTKKERILEMILSHDDEIRHLGATLAIQDPEWILSLSKASSQKRITTIDFCEMCMDTSERRYKRFVFTHKNNYYLLVEAGLYISCYSLTNISKKEYEQYNNTEAERENN